jgi:hypothetical protein
METTKVSSLISMFFNPEQGGSVFFRELLAVCYHIPVFLLKFINGDWEY